MKATLKFGPRVSTLSASPEDLEKILRWAARGANWEARDYANGEPDRARCDAAEELFRKMVDELIFKTIEHYQDKGL